MKLDNSFDMCAWDGKERRRGGKAEELRQRITELQQQWNKERRAAPKPVRKPRRTARKQS